ALFTRSSLSSVRTTSGSGRFFFFFFWSSGRHRELHSFPTRRSSDLDAGFGRPCETELLELVQSLDCSRLPDCLVTVETLDKLKEDRKSTRLNSSHSQISYAVFCLKKKKNRDVRRERDDRRQRLGLRR